MESFLLKSILKAGGS